MEMFVVRLDSGDYVTKCEITSNYLNYERTANRSDASRLNHFESQLVIKRLRILGEKNPSREEVQGPLTAVSTEPKPDDSRLP